MIPCLQQTAQYCKKHGDTACSIHPPASQCPPSNSPSPPSLVLAISPFNQPYLLPSCMQRGLFERHKLLFALMLTNKILVNANKVKPADLDVFLKGGGALDISSVRKKPKEWIPDGVWLNIIALSNLDAFRDIPDSVFRNDGLWRQWYDQEAPEMAKVSWGQTKLLCSSICKPLVREVMAAVSATDRQARNNACLSLLASEVAGAYELSSCLPELFMTSLNNFTLIHSGTL